MSLATWECHHQAANSLTEAEKKAYNRHEIEHERYVEYLEREVDRANKELGDARALAWATESGKELGETIRGLNRTIDEYEIKLDTIRSILEG